MLRGESSSPNASPAPGSGGFSPSGYLSGGGGGRVGGLGFRAGGGGGESGGFRV